MKFQKAFFSVCFIFAFCSPETGIPVLHSKACDLENDGKILEIPGYLEDEGSVFCSNTGGRLECGFELVDQLQNSKSISIYIKEGNSSNSIEKIESGYSEKDLKIHGDDDELLSLKQPITVIGKITTVKDPDEVCYVKVFRLVKK